ncbi:S66 peptidase family protein [Arachidicoccus soli]|uniref:LD-carboxypeptidase n=1 Tax=Arachidicoccus soli TaxID=2341117 RepID=A0A386HSK2_9BACT|nr:LD-carboxypeptidase [Arachidicoccus soli]AYD48682.1 LD-carboxypeptidase [Arachidicoccus soli]
MERKKFLHTSGILLTSPFFSKLRGNYDDSNSAPIIIPPYLKAGDTIGITSPSGYILEDELQPAIALLQSWGLKIEIGKTIGERDGTFGGSDEARAADFQQMLDKSYIKAILCARGGYGALRIIDKINFSHLRQHPKWVIGFSDATVFHCHIATRFGVATIHSKMCNSFPTDWNNAPEIQKQSILSIRDTLMGTQKMQYVASYNQYNKIGSATGRIIGGNLRTIENLSGTLSAIHTENKILFIEETHEYLYNIDRMLWNLKRSGKLKKLNGLIIGGFKVQAQPDPQDELNLSLYDLVLEKIKDYNFPVCFDFPVGHQINNFALKCNVHHYFSVSTQGTILNEI